MKKLISFINTNKLGEIKENVSFKVLTTYKSGGNARLVVFPNSIKNLIESFKYLPGIGEKTAERLAFSVLDLEEEQIDLFSSSLLSVHNNIHKCAKCNTLTDNDLCYICSDTSRISDILCVVEDSKSVFLFEKLGMFKGKYHVLEGLISPLEGINPEDIKINQLIQRIKNDNIKEVILATDMDSKGETTAVYLAQLIKPLGIKVSRLGYGMPVGGDIEYADEVTISRAIAGRKEM